MWTEAKMWLQKALFDHVQPKVDTENNPPGQRSTNFPMWISSKVVGRAETSGFNPWGHSQV